MNRTFDGLYPLLKRGFLFILPKVTIWVIAFGKIKRERKGTTVKIIEEMADVLIMVEQIVYLSGIDRKDIDECIQYKLDRQMKRIEAEK